MKRWLMALGLLIVPGLVGFLVYYQRAAHAREVAQARALVGRRSGGPLLEQLVQQQPNNAELHFLLARQLRLEEKLPDAQAELAAASKLGWSSELVERERLYCAAQVAFPQVEGRLAQLLNSNPEDRELLLVLIRGYEKAGRLDRAEVLAGQILEQTPDDSEALLLRGRIRLRQGHVERACQDLERSLPGAADRLHEAETRLVLANGLLDQGKFDAALVLYRQASAAEPTNPLALFGLGRTAIFLNRWDEALQAMEAVLVLRPDHPETLLELARIHEWRGELPRALELLRRAEPKVPNRPEFLGLMAKVLGALDQNDEAAVYSRRCAEQQLQSGRQEPHRAGGLDNRDLGAKTLSPLGR